MIKRIVLLIAIGLLVLVGCSKDGTAENEDVYTVAIDVQQPDTDIGLHGSSDGGVVSLCYTTGDSLLAQQIAKEGNLLMVDIATVRLVYSHVEAMKLFDDMEINDTIIPAQYSYRVWFMPLSPDAVSGLGRVQSVLMRAIIGDELHEYTFDPLDMQLFHELAAGKELPRSPEFKFKKFTENVQVHLMMYAVQRTLQGLPMEYVQKSADMHVSADSVYTGELTGKLSAVLQQASSLLSADFTLEFGFADGEWTISGYRGAGNMESYLFGSRMDIEQTLEESVVFCVAMTYLNEEMGPFAALEGFLRED